MVRNGIRRSSIKYIDKGLVVVHDNCVWSELMVGSGFHQPQEIEVIRSED